MHSNNCNHESVDASVNSKSYKQDNSRKPSVKQLNPSFRKVLAGSLIIGFIMLVGIGFYVCNKKDVNFTKGVSVTIKGFDGYGSVDVSRPKNDLGIYEYTRDQKSAIKKYNEHILTIMHLLPLYYDQLKLLKEKNVNYDPDILTNLSLYDNQELSITNIQNIQSFNDPFDIVKQAAWYGNTYGDISLNKCELIYPEGKENGNLSNGDQIIYQCKLSEFAKEVLDINGNHQYKITVNGLGNGNVINLDEIIKPTYTVELAGYDGFRVVFNYDIDETLLPSEISLNSDIMINVVTNQNVFEIISNTSRNDILFVSKRGKCMNENACAYTFEMDEPQIDELRYFDDAKFCSNYNSISNIVSNVVDAYFDNIEWKVEDENGNDFTVTSYKLIKYGSGNQFGRNVDFEVELSNGQSYSLRLFGILIYNNGELQFVTSNDQKILGKVEESGVLR